MEEAVDICRVCRCEGTADAPLFNPCLCTGSIRFVHQDCLKSWLEHSKKKRCELCNHEYRFARVYRATPREQHVSLRDVTQALARASGALASRSVRILTVVLAWGLLLPLAARYTWMALFEHAALDAHWRLALFAFDGGDVAATKPIVEGGNTHSVWEEPHPLRRFLWEWGEGGLICAVFFSVALGILGLRDFIVAHNLPIGDPLAVVDNLQGHNNEEEEEEEEEEEIDELAHQIEDESEGEENFGAEAPLPAHMGHEDHIAQDDHNAHMHDVPDHHVEEDAQPEEAGDEGLVVGEEAEQAFIPEPEQDPPAEDHFDPENVLPNGEEVDDLLNNEDLGLEQLLGLVGPIQNLFTNLFWMMVINAVTMITFAFIPLKMGSLLLFMFNLMPTSNALTKTAVGYGMILFGAAFLTNILSMSPRHAARYPLFNKLLSFFCAFLKVGVLLLVEIGLCPLLLGGWLDICSLDFLGASLKDRKLFFLANPWTSSFVHWLVGMVFMHHFAAFVALLREILRKGVLWFFRDPQDPDFHPLRQILCARLPSYTLRLFLIISLYATIIALAFYLPARTAAALVSHSSTHSHLPFTATLNTPLDLFAINFALPYIAQYSGLQTAFKSFVAFWIRSVSAALNITEYMLPPAQPAAPDAVPHKPKYFALRIVCLLLFTAYSIYALCTLVALLPVRIGRALFALTLAQQTNDVFNFAVGSLVLYGLAFLLYSLRHRSRELLEFVRLRTVLRTTSTAISLCVGAILLLILFPVVLGTVVDVFIILPVKVYAGMSPSMSMWQSWGIGIFGLISFLRIDPMFAGRYRVHYDTIVNNGIANFSLYPLWQLVGGVMMQMLLALALPYALTFGLLGNIPGIPSTVTYTVYRLVYPSILSLAIFNFGGWLAFKALVKIYEKAKDDKYLVGETLLNYDGTENLPGQLEVEG